MKMRIRMHTAWMFVRVQPAATGRATTARRHCRPRQTSAPACDGCAFMCDEGSSRGSTSSLTPRKRAVLIYDGYCYWNGADAELRILGCVGSATASRWRHHSSGQGGE